MSQETAIAPASRAPVQARNGVVLSSMDEMVRFASALARSGLAPKGFQNEQACFIAIQMGAELGLPPMASVQNIAVINGRPSLWGDAQLAVVRNTGELEEFDEWFEAAGKRLERPPIDFADDTVAVCKVKRKGFAVQYGTFSVKEAKRADLWGKQGPWQQYPGRMLKFRARSFVLRDNFGDALRGLLTAEEVGDLPTLKMADVSSEQPALPAPITPANFGTPAAPKAPASTPPPDAQESTPPPSQSPAPEKPATGETTETVTLSALESKPYGKTSPKFGQNYDFCTFTRPDGSTFSAGNTGDPIDPEMIGARLLVTWKVTAGGNKLTRWAAARAVHQSESEGLFNANPSN